MNPKFPESFKKYKMKTQSIHKEDVPRDVITPIIYGQDTTIRKIMGESEFNYPDPTINQEKNNK